MLNYMNNGRGFKDEDDDKDKNRFLSLFVYKKIWGFVFALHFLVLIFFFFTETSIPKKLIQQKTIVKVISLPKHNRALKSDLAFLDQPIANLLPMPPPEPIETPSIEDPIQEDSPVIEEISEKVEAEPVRTEKQIPQPASPPKITQTKKTPPKKSEKKTTPSKPTPIAKAAPVPKTPPKQAPKSSQITSKSKNTPKKPAAKKASTPSKEQEKILSLMKKSLAQLDNTSSTIGGKNTSHKGNPKSSFNKIDSLGSETISLVSAVAAYQDELIMYLKHLLQLPEIGEVKLRLTLTDKGKVTQVAIIKASSDKLRQYVEKKVPEISFPAFDERMNGEKQHTFPVTLTSTK